MIQNYIKMAIRTLRNNIGFTAINVLGLSVGLATCLLIVFYVVDELSYDKYNINADRIFRISDDVRLNGREASYAPSGEPYVEVMKAFPEVEKFTRMIPIESLFISPKKYFIRKGNQDIEEHNIVY